MSTQVFPSFNDHNWDAEIDCLLDSILHETEDDVQLSSPVNNSPLSTPHLSSDELSHSSKSNSSLKAEKIIVIQQKGLMPSRRNRRKLRKQLLAAHPSSFKPTMRVLKRDIRKKYCEMMTNVINNHDGSLLKQFLQQFCLPECNVYDPAPAGPASVLKSKPCNIVGINEIAETWITGFQLMPDFTFQLYDSYIFAAPNQHHSRIVSKVAFRGTKVFDFFQDLPYLSSFFSSQSGDGMSFQQLPQVKSIIDLVKNQMGNGNSFQSLIELFSMRPPTSNTKKDGDSVGEVGIPPANSNIDGLQIFKFIQSIQQFQLLSQPIAYTIDGILTTFVDESNRILKFQFDCTHLDTRFASLSI